MGDEEDDQLKVYVYTGDRAEGLTRDVTAGEEPKVLNQTVTLLGARDGEGEAAFANGDHYKGGFAEGLRGGAGTYTYAAPPPTEDEEPKPPVAVYEGHYKDGEKKGVGTMTYANGAKYHGAFVNGKFHGTGTMYYAAGDIYTGEWVEGKKQGVGTYIYKETGAKLKGEWLMNVVQSGVFTDKWGNSYLGEFAADAKSSLYSAGGTFALVSGATDSVDDKVALHEKLDKIAAGHVDEIGALFRALDADHDGTLSEAELRETLAEYMGVSTHQFDSAVMMQAFDTHGTPDGKIDERELRWYLADWALCFADAPTGDVVGAAAALPEVIADLQAIVDKRSATGK